MQDRRQPFSLPQYQLHLRIYYIIQGLKETKVIRDKADQVSVLQVLLAPAHQLNIQQLTGFRGEKGDPGRDGQPGQCAKVLLARANQLITNE